MRRRRYPGEGGKPGGRLIAFSEKFMRSEPIRQGIRASLRDLEEKKRSRERGGGEGGREEGNKRGSQEEGKLESRGSSITVQFNAETVCDSQEKIQRYFHKSRFRVHIYSSAIYEELHTIISE